MFDFLHQQACTSAFAGNGKFYVCGERWIKTSCWFGCSFSVGAEVLPAHSNYRGGGMLEEVKSKVTTEYLISLPDKTKNQYSEVITFL